MLHSRVTSVRSVPTRYRALLCCALCLALFTSSCNRARAPDARREASGISVVTNSGLPIVVRTTAAEFRLFSSGYLQATLLHEGQSLTLDDPGKAGGDSGDSVLTAGREIRDFVLDMEHAKVSGASGRLGARGKRIEVAGKSQSVPALEKTVVVEVY